MKRIHIAGLLCVLFALTAPASAQNPLSQFVIGGDTAKKIHDTATINLATAERITQACERLAAKEGVAISVYILDNAGNHVYMCVLLRSKSLVYFVHPVRCSGLGGIEPCQSPLVTSQLCKLLRCRLNVGPS